VCPADGAPLVLGFTPGAAATEGEPQRPLTVLVPGLGLDDRAWAFVRDKLHRPVRTVFLPALGRRSSPGMDLGVERQADRLLRQLTMDGANAVVLVGHSASCAVVVEAAARSPIVVGLVLIGPVTDPREWTWPSMVGQWLRTARHERPWELRVLVPQYWRAGAPTMARGMDAMRWYRTDLALARLDLPVVVVRGGKDRIAGAHWSRTLAAIARGRLQTVWGAGHMVPLTHPEAVVLAVHEVGSAVRKAAQSKALPRQSHARSGG
jgi:pimeloyl-ACP methyl ester carboxylesterase